MMWIWLYYVYTYIYEFESQISITEKQKNEALVTHTTEYNVPFDKKLDLSVKKSNFCGVTDV